MSDEKKKKKKLLHHILDFTEGFGPSGIFLQNINAFALMK